MKKLLIILFLAGCTWSCTKLQSQDDGEKSGSKQVDNSIKDTEIVLDYSDSVYRSLTVQQALNLKATYIKSHKKGDTESIYYTLDELKNLVWYIEYHAKATKLKDIDAKDLGVNVHFGKYPSAKELQGFPLEQKEIEDYAGKQTVFFVPTIIRGEKRFEFDPKKNHQEIADGKSNDIKPLSEHYKNDIATFKTIDYKDGSPVMDMGRLQPPYDN